MDNSVSCMVLPVGDVSFLLPCTAVVEIFKAQRGSGFDYEDHKTGIAIGRVEWRYHVVPAVDMAGLTNCENRVSLDDYVFFAIINTAIKNKSGALMYLAVALDDMPSLVKISANSEPEDSAPSLYSAHACTDMSIDGFGRVFIPDMKEVVRVFLGLSSVKISTVSDSVAGNEVGANDNIQGVFATGSDEDVYALIASKMSDSASEESSVAAAARSILRAASAVLVEARNQHGTAITTSAISRATELGFMLSALSGTAVVDGKETALTIDVVALVSDALKSIDGFSPEFGEAQDAAVLDGYGYAQMSIAYIIDELQKAE